MRDSLSPIKCLEVAVSDVPGKCRDDFATEREAMHSGHSRGRRPLDITQQTWLPRLDTGPIFGKPTLSGPTGRRKPDSSALVKVNRSPLQFWDF
jgi:hypothetical protein